MSQKFWVIIVICMVILLGTSAFPTLAKFDPQQTNRNLELNREGTPVPAEQAQAPHTPTAPPPPVYLSLPTLQASKGKALSIDLSIDTDSQNRATQFGVNFDPAVLRCDSVEEGAYYQDWAASNSASTLVFPSPTCDNENGVISDMGITLLGATGMGPTGAGVIATLHFTTLANGVSSLELVNVIVADADPDHSNSLPVTLTNGQVTVEAGQFVYLPVILH